MAPWLALAATLVAVAPEPTDLTDLTAPPEDEANPLIIAGTSLAIVGVLAAWGYGAWWNEGTRSFHFIDTGFLNRDTYAGGADKLGHTYACYIAARAVTQLYEALGMRRTGAALLSAGAVTLVANGIEVADGFTDYGFEYGDVLFNTLGIGLGLASDLSPEVASLLGMRISYVPSRDFLANDKTFIKWINDYTGMLFYFDVKGKGLMELLGAEPGLLRYMLGGVVWGTERYSPVRVHEERRRSLGVHVGLSLPEILRAAYDDDPGVESFAVFFDYYAMPFLTVSVMTDLNRGDWMINFGVANRAELDLD